MASATSRLRAGRPGSSWKRGWSRISTPFLVLLLAGCIHMPRDVRQQLDCPPAQASNYGGARACKSDVEAVIAKAGNTQRRVASIGEVPYQTGQIILIERPGAVSLFLSLMAERFAPYIHAGVIVVDDGTPYVYEAFGFLMPRMSGSPTDGMRGGVRRVTLASFLKRDGIIAIFEPPEEIDRAAIAAYVRLQAARRTPFDGYFDSTDAARLYCVEFVAHALEAGGAEWPAGSPVSANASALVARKWLKITAPELLLAGDLVNPARRVWLSGRRYSEAQIDAYFKLKQELHRRFTSEQKLGSLLRWRAHSLRLRPAVQWYFDAGMAEEASDPRVLAVRIFDDETPPAIDAYVGARPVIPH